MIFNYTKNYTQEKNINIPQKKIYTEFKVGKIPFFIFVIKFFEYFLRTFG